MGPIEYVEFSSDLGVTEAYNQNESEESDTVLFITSDDTSCNKTMTFYINDPREDYESLTVTAHGIEITYKESGYDAEGETMYEYYWYQNERFVKLNCRYYHDRIESLINNMTFCCRASQTPNKFEFTYPNNSYVTGITFNEGVNAYNIQYNGAESTDFQFIYFMYLVGDSDPVTYEHHTSYSEGYGVSYENTLGTLMSNAQVTYMVQYEGLENQTYWYTYEFEGGRVIYKDVAGKPLKDISYFESLSDAIKIEQVV